jgi:hypothetical protein
VKKWLVRGTLGLLLVAGVLVANMFINFGLPFGYYGELNRLTGALESLPGISIERVSYNPDLALEEIAFWIQDAEGRRRKLDFGQNDPIRKLWGNELSTAMAKRLAE